MILLAAHLQVPDFTPTAASQFHAWQLPAGYTQVSESGWRGAYWYANGALILKWAPDPLVNAWVTIEVYGGNVLSGDASLLSARPALNFPTAAGNASGYCCVRTGTGSPPFINGQPWQGTTSSVLADASVAVGRDIRVTLTTPSAVLPAAVHVEVSSDNVVVFTADLDAALFPTGHGITAYVMPGLDYWRDALDPGLTSTQRRDSDGRVDGWTEDDISQAWHHPADLALSSDILATGSPALAWPADYRHKVYDTAPGDPGKPTHWDIIGPTGTHLDYPWLSQGVALAWRSVEPVGNLVRLACGAEVISRDGYLWRRDVPGEAWTQGAAWPEGYPVKLLCRHPSDDSVWGEQLYRSGDAGRTLADAYAGAPPWIGGHPNILTDGGPMPGNGACVGVVAATENGAHQVAAAHEGTALPALVADVTDAPRVYPLIWRERTGALTVTVCTGGQVREWSGAGGLAEWQAATPVDVEDLDFDNAAGWDGTSGARGIVGANLGGGVRLLCRQAGVWAQVATWEADNAAPYLCQLPTGRWELGWRADGDWVRHQADSLAGTWSVIS